MRILPRCIPMCLSESRDGTVYIVAHRSEMVPGLALLNITASSGTGIPILPRMTMRKMAEYPQWPMSCVKSGIKLLAPVAVRELREITDDDSTAENNHGLADLCKDREIQETQ